MKIKLTDFLKEGSSDHLTFPEGFQPAKEVPTGGAMCANCAKWNDKESVCEGEYYIKWNGSGEIHEAKNKYVCIWWVSKIKK